MKIKLFGGAMALLLLAGCDAVTEAKLAREYRELTEDCFDYQLTYSCARKIANYNIRVLETVPFASENDKKEIVEAFGEEGWAIWLEDEQKIKALMIKENKADRPNLLMSWLLGNMEAIDGQAPGVLSPENLNLVRVRAARLYAEKMVIKRQQSALTLKNYSLGADETDVEPEYLRADVQQDHERAGGQPSVDELEYALSTAVDQLVSAELADRGGAEYEEERKTLWMDLNDDGLEDALVLYTVEGQWGSNSSSQTLAAFIRTPDGWQFGNRMDVGQVTGIKPLGSGVFALESLDYAEDDPRCCPSLEKSVRYIWKGHSFVEHIGR